MEIKERLELAQQIKDELPTDGKQVTMHYALAAELVQIGILPPAAGMAIPSNYLAAVLNSRIQELEILKGRRTKKDGEAGG